MLVTSTRHNMPTVNNLTFKGTYRTKSIENLLKLNLPEGVKERILVESEFYDEPEKLATRLLAETKPNQWKQPIFDKLCCPFWYKHPQVRYLEEGKYSNIRLGLTVELERDITTKRIRNDIVEFYQDGKPTGNLKITLSKGIRNYELFAYLSGNRFLATNPQDNPKIFELARKVIGEKEFEKLEKIANTIKKQRDSENSNL